MTAEIATLPGVSAAETAMLAELGLHTSDDLLRTNRLQLCNRLPALTPAKVLRWEAYAQLIQLQEITAAEAALLHAAGFNGVSEVAVATFHRLQNALPDAVDDERLMVMIKDAVRLVHTGVLNGTVTLKDGTPVDGANVTVTGDAYTTDARGRFRALRLELDRKVIVEIHHPSLGYKLVKNIPASRASALEGKTFQLPGKPMPAPTLSQLRGDALPAIASAEVTTRSPREAPDPSDILLFIDLYPNGDARVASRFLDFAQGKFIRRVYRIKAADLPAGGGSGGSLVWKNGAWTRKEFCDCALARQIRVRKAMRTLPSPPWTDAQKTRAFTALAKALSD